MRRQRLDVHAHSSSSSFILLSRNTFETFQSGLTWSTKYHADKVFRLWRKRRETARKRSVRTFQERYSMSIWQSSRCKKCKGEKTVKGKNRQELVIEKGMTDRYRIIMTGAGDEEVCIPSSSIFTLLMPFDSRVYPSETWYSFSKWYRMTLSNDQGTISLRTSLSICRKRY